MAVAVKALFFDVICSAVRPGRGKAVPKEPVVIAASSLEDLADKLGVSPRFNRRHATRLPRLAHLRRSLAFTSSRLTAIYSRPCDGTSGSAVRFSGIKTRFHAKLRS